MKVNLLALPLYNMITVNGLNITDNTTYLVEEVAYKQIPKRDVQSAPVSTRPGSKLLATEWSDKNIKIRGRVFGNSYDELVTNVDTLQKNFAVQSLALQIDTNRTYTATLTSLDIPTQFFNNTMVQYSAEFLCIDPFSYGPLLTVSGTTVSGTTTLSGMMTISGTVFAEPVLTINPKGAPAGNSGIKGLTITHVPTGETLTLSGVFNYTSDLVIDYKNFLVTNSGVASDYLGIFSRFEPGSLDFQITVTSGVAQGYNWKFTYQPRYYQ